MQKEFNVKLRTLAALVVVALLATIVPLRSTAQDDDDPPTRAARLGHVDGSVSFQPAGESEWEAAVPNRPMTTGDKLWADRDSRAGVQLGSTSIQLDSNTGISFLNLDDRTVQIQLSSGSINVRVRHLEHDDVFEIDTPNQAFSIYQPGRYRIEASEDGTSTVVTVREGEGESTGNGQTYNVHAGQRVTFSGTDRLNADFEQVGEPDAFDRWSEDRDRHYDDSRSSRYVSPDVVGAQDLDEYGDWQPNPEYGNVWYPHVGPGWAPYHDGHWAWIDPWGWTWVDDEPWGYAPFHYGRWAFVAGRWGWIPGPREVRPVYAPALVVFVGGGPGGGSNVAWFPLGPREVYVPPYRVSPAYVNRVNISNTTVTQTTVTNVYNTTIVNNNTTITNVTYANRNVNGAVTAVPQQAFAGGQPVARAAVPMTRQQIAAAPVSARVAVAPTQSAVMRPRASTTNPVAAPPRAMFTRPVIAKAAPPPAPVSFAAKQQVLAAHPGQPVARQEMQRLRPATPPANQPVVRQAPPGRPATPTSPGNMAHPGNQPGNPPGNQPAYRPMNPNANERPAATPPPNRSQPNQPAANQPQNRPAPNRPEPNQPEINRPSEPPARNDRPPVAQPPASRPTQPSQPPQNTRPAEPPRQNEAPPRPQPNYRPPQNQPPAETRPPQTQQHPQPQPAPQTPEEKKRQEEQKKQDQKPH